MAEQFGVLEHRFDLMPVEMGELRAEVRELRSDLSATRAEISSVRSDFRRSLATVDQDQAALRTHLENALERKTWVLGERLGDELSGRQADLERRIGELEAAERRRREGMGA